MLSDEAIKKRDELAEEHGYYQWHFKEGFEAGVEFERARSQKLVEVLCNEINQGGFVVLTLTKIQKLLGAHKAGE